MKLFIRSLALQNIKADYILIPLYGQSLSLNQGPAERLTPVGNLWQFDDGIINEPDNTSVLIPLEKFNDTLTNIMQIIDVSSSKIVGCTPGLGGGPLSFIDKGTAPYTKLIANVTELKRIADSEAKTMNVPAIPFAHGEQDTLGNNYDYKDDLFVFINDLNTDIKAITGQTNDVILCQYQNASHARYGKYPFLPMLQLDAANENTRIILSKAMYNGDYFTETNVHGKDQLYSLMGVKYGYDVFDIIQGKTKRNFNVQSHSYSGLKSTIIFNVPFSPLVLDEVEVSGHLDGFYGFKLFDRFLDPTDSGGGGTGNSTISEPLAVITDVSLISNDTIEITYDIDPTGSYLTYGVNGTGWEEVDGLLDNPNFLLGRVNGARGNLRDSMGEIKQFSVEDITGTEIYNKIHNWCPIFEILI